MAVPRPGQVVRGSATGRPLMAALDLLGRRWALRILWELTAGPLGARELRQRCDAMSPSVLYQRLAELTEARLISQDTDSRYRLTPMGQALGAAIAPLDHWAKAWARQTAGCGRPG
jgi:DNA-binding HxlR family transcriptional regulator